tara:strand:- start:113 stop:1924 length:1812 start_codon:yes stop_codon:yes gene_type:complete
MKISTFFKKNIHNLNISTFIVSGVFFLCLTIVLWGSGKALGFNDEGVYFLAAKYPSEIKQMPSSVYIYSGYLFQLVDHDPQKFRVLGVLLLLVSSVVLWIGSYNFISRYTSNKGNALTLLFFLLLGSLCHYQWFFMTPHYNTLMGVGINISAGLLLYNLSVNHRANLFIYLFIGILTGFLTFIKFPAGFALLFFYSAIVIRKNLIASIFIVLGFLLWPIFHFSFIQDFSNWWIYTKEGYELYGTLGLHTPENKIFTYIIDFIYYIYESIRIFWVSYIPLVLALLGNFSVLNKYKDKFYNTAIYLSFTIAILLSIEAAINPMDYRYSSEDDYSIWGMIALPIYHVFHIGWIILLCFSIGINRILYKKFSINFDILIVLLILFLVPFIAALGTANPLYNIPLVIPAAWFALIYILLLYLPIRHSIFKLLVLTYVTVFTGNQIIQGFIYDPQQIDKKDITEQNYTTNIDYRHQLELDNEQGKFIEKMYTLLSENGFKVGDDIIAFNYTAGLVYALGGVSPGHPVFFSCHEPKRQACNAYTKKALSYSDIDRLKKSYIIVNVELKPVARLLRERGLNFPGGYFSNRSYDYLGDIKYGPTYHSVWAPK